MEELLFSLTSSNSPQGLVVAKCEHERLTSCQLSFSYSFPSYICDLLFKWLEVVHVVTENSVVSLRADVYHWLCFSITGHLRFVFE